MDKAKKLFCAFVRKYGNTIACCALAFVALASNSSCAIPFYEPEEPKGLDAFKKFN